MPDLTDADMRYIHGLPALTEQVHRQGHDLVGVGNRLAAIEGKVSREELAKLVRQVMAEEASERGTCGDSIR